MSGSYIPEYVYGPIPGTYGEQDGLLPWPKHLQPRGPSVPDEAKQAAPEAMPSLVNAGGVFFVTFSPDDRAGIATTIERLINMLDTMDGDENLEGTGDDEPWLGWTGNGPQSLDKNAIHDDREGEAHWTDAGPMYELEQDSADNEPSLGWTDDIDQSQTTAGDSLFFDCELDAGDHDVPGFIVGGNEAAETRP